MSISDNKANSSASASGARAESFVSNPTVDYNKMADSAPGLTKINNKMFLGMSRSRATTSDRVLMNAISDLVKVSSLPVTCDITLIENKTRQIPLSVIAFHVNIGSTVFYTVLMIEGSEVGQILPMRHRRDNQPDLMIDRPASDLYDAATLGVIQEALLDTYSEANAGLVNAVFRPFGAIVVPIELTAGQTEEQLLKSIQLQELVWFSMNNLMNGVGTVEHDPVNEFNLKWLAADAGSRLSANVEHNNTPVFTSGGLPVRSDATVTLEAASKDGLQSAKFTTASKIIRTSVYADLAYVEQAVAGGWLRANGVQVADQDVTQRYQPRIVISRVDSPADMRITPAMYMLGIAQASAFLRNNMWVGLFEPNYGHGRNTRDIQDIGAVGYELRSLTENDQPAMIDTRSDAFRRDRNNLPSLVSAAMLMAPVFVMHVTEASDLGSVQAVYAAAAAGESGARNALFKIADQLTLGQFSVCWAKAQYGDSPLVVSTNTLLPMGYYSDANGNPADLRDFAYVAQLNIHGPTDPLTVEAYSECVDQPTVDAYERLHDLIAHHKKTIGGTVVIKEFAHQLVLTNQFMSTLLSAFTANSFTVDSNSIGSYEVISSNRGNSSVVAYGMNANQSNVFTSGYNRGNDGIKPKAFTPIY